MAKTGNVVPSIVKAEHIGPDDTGDNIEAKRVAGYQWDGSNWTRTPLGGTAVLKKEIDDTTTPSVTYIGEAPLGSATSDAVWRIKKIDESSGVEITWGGTGVFDQVYDNRATSVVYN